MELFKSKRFWSGIVGIVMMVLVNFVPELASNADTLTTGILIVVGLLIGGYSVEDAVLARGGVVNAISGPAYEVTEQITIEEAQG